MPKEITKAEANLLHEFREELLTIKAQGMGLVYRAGQIFKEVRDKELWRAGYDSFVAFYSDNEIGYDTSQVNRAIKIAETFKLEEVVLVPLGKVYAIIPHITKENKVALLKMAESLSRSDLRHQLVVKKLVERLPKLKTLPKIYPCNVCLKAKGVSFDELCHCGWTKEQFEVVSKLTNHFDFGGEIPKNLQEDY